MNQAIIHRGQLIIKLKAEGTVEITTIQSQLKSLLAILTDQESKRAMVVQKNMDTENQKEKKFQDMTNPLSTKLSLDEMQAIIL